MKRLINSTIRWFRDEKMCAYCLCLLSRLQYTYINKADFFPIGVGYSYYEETVSKTKIFLEFCLKFGIMSFYGTIFLSN